MRNINTLRKLGVILLTLLLIVVAWITIQTHLNRAVSNPNPLIHFTIQYYVPIMVALIGISIAYGFLWSAISYREIRKKQVASRTILDVVLMFLVPEEKQIVSYLVEQKGSTTQANISRLSGMSRVKAYRCLQRLQSKNIIDVVPHGKVRKIRLKETLLNTLLETNQPQISEQFK